MTPAGSLPEAGGERRQVTVVFCDLVDSTGLSERLDPEDLRELLDTYLGLCSGVIEALGGGVVDQAGDGIVAQFGFPATQEDAAAMAVRAALDIPRALASLRARFAAEFGETIAVRVGLSTGVVVVGEAGSGRLRQAGSPVGETLNLAARLQALAAPDTVVLGEATERLIRGRFELRPLGDAVVRGLSRPLRVFQVVGELRSGDRFAARAGAGLAPLVDREAEMKLLVSLAGMAQSGHGQVVFLTGEAGIGKSRLARELRAASKAGDFLPTTLHGSQHHQNVAYYPIAEHLERIAASRRGDAPEGEARERLVALLQNRGVRNAQALRTLEELLAPAAVHDAAAPPEDPQARRRRVRDALVSVLLETAEKRPVLLLVEDAHWLDPSTLEVLERAVPAISERSVLMLVTSRGEPRLAVPPGVAATSIGLDRLSEAESAWLAAALAGERRLPEPILRQIVARSDGVPLFAEELTRAALETGGLGGEAPMPGEGWVPASLYDPLMVRLDRLGDGKRVAQLAAALGRSFRADILRAVAGGGPGRPDVDAALERLTALGVVQRVREDAPLFVFKHAMLRDVAYESLLRRDRRAIHGAIAGTIEAQFPDVAEAEPDYLAQHFSQAKQYGAAFRNWVGAARRSVARSANLEAISQLRAALAELKGIPAGPERDAMELEAQTALLGPVMAALGYGHPEFAATGQRAFELCRELDCGARVFPVLYSLWSHSWVTGDLQEAYRVAHEFLRLAERQDQPGARVVGHRLCGSSLTSIGAPADARAQLERAVALYEPARDRALALSYGSDVRVVSLCHLAIACWLLGEQERASAHGAEALTEAAALGHANTLGYAVAYVCMLHVLERDGERVEVLARRMLSVAMEKELPFWESVARGFLGWAAVQTGRVEEGIAALERTLTFARAANMVQWMPNCLGWLAEAYGAVGQPARGHACLEEAAAIMQRGGEAWWEPERRRLSGELLLREGRGEAARACFEEAVDAARGRGEKSLELRAVLALARQLAATGRRGEARAWLAAAMAPFEGEPPGADQREARALLEATAAAQETKRGGAPAVRRRTDRPRRQRQDGPAEDPKGA